MVMGKVLQMEGFDFLMKNRLKLYKECIKLIKEFKNSNKFISKIDYNEVYLIGYNNQIDYDNNDEKNCYGDYWIFYIGKISEKEPNMLKYSFDLFRLYNSEYYDEEEKHKLYFENDCFSGHTFIIPINITIKTMLCKAYHNKVLKLLQNNNNNI